MADLVKNKCRIIKIGKEALFEFIYENFIAQQEELLEVKSVDVANNFAIDWEEGSFIFCAHACEDENEKIAPFPEDININELLRELPNTTDSVLSQKPFKEYSFDELREVVGKIQ